MKRKYFLRGMGIGIFVTALLFTIALIFESPSMSEDEIKREAAKLGMVMASDSANSDSESSSSYDEDVAEDVSKSASEAKAQEEANKSSELAAEEERQSAEEEKDEANETVKQTTTEETSSASEETSSSTKTSTSSSAKKNSSSTTKTTSTEASGEAVDFVVTEGENSYTVGAHLFRDGLVDDAGSFDSYLEQNGYDNRIQKGTFNIPKGSTYEEIAKILTGG